MKQASLFFLLTCLALHAPAQTFGPVGSKWTYCYAVNALGGLGGRDSLVVESVADTQFGGLPCREMHITYCWSHGNSGCGLVSTFHICQDDKKAYYQEEDSLYLLHDFGALPGDTLRIRYPLLLDTFNQEVMGPFFNPPARPYFDLVILDTATLHLNGQNLRTQTFATISLDDDYFGPAWHGQFVEGIGSTGGWLLPRAIGGLQEEHIPSSIISFVAPDNAYRYDYPNSCFLSAVRHPLSEAAPLVFPTLFQDQLFVVFPADLSHPTFRLYDHLGQLVKEEKITLGTNTIDVENVWSGIYFWQVIVEGKTLMGGKCVKHF